MINFKSKITQAVLGYFFINPRVEMYLNEMARKFKVDRGNLVRKLAELEGEGILLKNKKGNLSLYTINRDYPFLLELKKIFVKSFGLEKELRDRLKGIAGLKTAIIFGSYAKDKLSAESDIDLLLVGSHKSLDAQREITKLQNKLDREINAIDMTASEFARRKKDKDEFIAHIFAGKIIKII